MIPSLAIIGFGGRRMMPLPLPFFLLWPFILLALCVVRLARWLAHQDRVSLERLALADAAILATFQLSGLRIDVRSRKHNNVYIWFL